MAQAGKKGARVRLTSGIAIFAVIAGAFAFVAARIATYFAAHGGLGPTTFSAALEQLPAEIKADPLGVNWGDPVALGAAGVVVGVMLLLVWGSAAKGQKLANEDTGAEHGDDRLATRKEMEAFCDRKVFSNNVLYSEHVGLAMAPHDKHTRAVLDGRNLNCITLGISGLGKTYNLVWPDLMQSVGDALEPLPYGVRNIPEHLKETRIAKTLSWAHGAIPVSLPKPKLPKKSEQPEPEPEPEVADSAATDAVAEEPDAASGERAARLRERFGAIRQSYIDTVGESEHSRAAKARKRAAVMGGYDVFNTDPKGDNVRDIGPMYEAAGYNVKVINTIDFADGLHFNPLAYIKSHAVDCRPADECRVKVRVSGPASPAEGAGQATVALGFDEAGNARADDDKKALSPGTTCTQAYSPASPRSGAPTPSCWQATASFNMETNKWSLDDLPEVSMTADEIDDAIDDVEEELLALPEEDPRREELVAKHDELVEQRDVLNMRSELAGGGQSGEKVADAISAFTYRRSSGTIDVRFKNLMAVPGEATVEIELDDGLVVDGVEACTIGEIEWPKDEDGDDMATGTITWKLGPVEPKRALHARGGADVAEAAVSEHLVLHVHMKTETVPDGVGLTKVVDCLVANLKGTDAQSNGSEDPFWEDTKRLCFMSLVAITFEMYGPEERNLPSVMRLLDMALADSGDPQDKSPLDCLMEKWEFARVYDPADEGADTGSRYAVAGGGWKPADNMPHDRSNSLALHCYHAFTSGAPETVQSVIISCQACLVNLVTDDVKEFLRYDELELDTLGDPGQKQVIFCVTKDTNSPFDFLTALVVYLAIDLAQDKAYKVYGGKLPRHVRFVLDEAANIGKIPILIRALAVVRSRNISISMYLQSKAQLALVYGKDEANVIFDNCSTIVFLGAQTEETLEEMSKKVGTETVQTRTFQRSFNSNSLMSSSTSENISSNERRVMSASKMSRLEKGYLMLFIFNSRAICDHKYKTRQHPLYAYINPGDARGWLQPLPRVEGRFDYPAYRAARVAEREAARQAS